MIVRDFKESDVLLVALKKYCSFDLAFEAILAEHPFPGIYITDYIGVSAKEDDSVESVALYLHDPETMPAEDVFRQRKMVLGVFRSMLTKQPKLFQLLGQIGDRLRLDPSVKIGENPFATLRVEFTPLDGDPLIRSSLLDALFSTQDDDGKSKHLVSKIMELAFPFLPSSPHPAFHSALALSRSGGRVDEIKLYFRNRRRPDLSVSKSLQILALALPDVNVEFYANSIRDIWLVANKSGMMFAFMGLDLASGGRVSSVKFYFDCDQSLFSINHLLSTVPRTSIKTVFSNFCQTGRGQPSVRYIAIEVSESDIAWKYYFR